MVNDEPPPEIQIHRDPETEKWYFVCGSHMVEIKDVKPHVAASVVAAWIMGRAAGPVKVRVVQ